MNASDLIRQVFRDEYAGMRKVLVMVPEDKLNFKPHDKSMTLGRLAGHCAELTEWTLVAIDEDQYDVAPGGVSAFKRYEVTTQKALLEYFDKNTAAVGDALGELKDEKLDTTWTLLNNSKTVFSMPRWKVLLSFNLNHMVHHRAQLGVYLRMNHIAVPGVYGPSQDDKDATAK